MNKLNFNDYKYFVLCDGLYDAGFILRQEAYNYLLAARKRNRGHIYKLVAVEDTDDRELERIRESYEDYKYYLAQLEEEQEL